MIDIEKLSDLELDELQLRYEKIRAACDARQKQQTPQKITQPTGK